MRDPARIRRIGEKLIRAWQTSPDLRLGQLVVNLAGTNDPFNVEDDRAEQALDRFIQTGKIGR